MGGDFRSEARHLATRVHISEDDGFDIHCCKHLVIFSCVLNLAIRQDKEAIVSIFVCSYSFVLRGEEGGGAYCGYCNVPHSCGR